MPPRNYRLGKRAAGVAKTRARIVESAAVLYEKRGIGATSMQEVARQAQVSPATVLKHFATPDALADAVVAHWLAELRVPEPDVFAELATMRERVERLAVELAKFYERSEALYHVYVREAASTPALARGEAEFFGRIDGLLRGALKELQDDSRVLQGVMAAMNPAVFGQLRSQGMTSEDAGRLVSEMLAPWLEQQARARDATRPNGTETQP